MGLGVKMLPRHSGAREARTRNPGATRGVGCSGFRVRGLTAAPRNDREEISCARERRNHAQRRPALLGAEGIEVEGRGGGGEDIATSLPDVTDIVKFHGDFDREETLVITESHYFDRLEFEAPLDILFRSDALSRPILFVGYSLADINMRYLFHKLGKLWKAAGPVSYTHLRAHETRHDLVCRLLL